LRELNWVEVDRIYAELIADARAALIAAGCEGKAISYSFAADLRYVGQQHEIAISLPDDPRRAQNADVIAKVFEAAYLAHYGVAPSHVDIEIVNWRLVAQGPAMDVAPNRASSGKVVAPKGTRRVHLWPKAPIATVFDRPFLAPGQGIEGPALIEERETTIVIPPDWNATIDNLGCVVAKRG
jgi:N-methylhydantoinase A